MVVEVDRLQRLLAVNDGVREANKWYWTDAYFNTEKPMWSWTDEDIRAYYDKNSDKIKLRVFADLLEMRLSDLQKSLRRTSNRYNWDWDNMPPNPLHEKHNERMAKERQRKKEMQEFLYPWKKENN
jgi:hypothetical protein|tara:strand:- start:2211 stop:2588 length:378 start_codon:yes stop_codon:yes gene_type:complete